MTNLKRHLQTLLEYLDWTPARLDLALFIPEGSVEKIMRGRERITPGVALRLEALTGQSAMTWLTLQAQDELNIQRHLRGTRECLARIQQRPGMPPLQKV